MFRITGSTVTGPQVITKPPVLTVSPMQNNSDFWINPNWPGVGGDPHAVELVRAGYDVWLGNVRGSVYGSYNDYREYGSYEFWNYSYVEQG